MEINSVAHSLCDNIRDSQGTFEPKLQHIGVTLIFKEMYSALCLYSMCALHRAYLRFKAHI